MKHVVLAAAAALVLAACASTPTVHTDSDPNANFSSFRTYTWLARPEGVPPLAAQRIVENVDAQLRAKGWTEAADGDVSIVAHVATQQRQTLDTMYSGPAFAGWGWRGGWAGAGMGMSTTTVRNFTEGTLIIDMFDSKTKQAIWRGTASGTVPSSPDQATAQIQAGVAKMFAGFPPGSAAAN